MSTESNEPIGQMLVVELLEAAINQALSLDSGVIERLRVHSGRVIRVKTYDPDFSFYLALCDDGVQLFSDHEGPIDARLRMSSWMFARHVLGVAPSEGEVLADGGEKLKVSGDTALLVEIFDILADYSVWALLQRIIQQWLPEFESLEDILRALREHEPAWMSRIEHLPQLVNETLVMLKKQSRSQERQSEEIRRIRGMLESDRRANQVSTVIGFVLIVVAFLTHNGSLDIAVFSVISLDTMVMLIVAMVLLVPRLIFPRQRRGNAVQEYSGASGRSRAQEQDGTDEHGSQDNEKNG